MSIYLSRRDCAALVIKHTCQRSSCRSAGSPSRLLPTLCDNGRRIDFTTVGQLHDKTMWIVRTSFKRLHFGGLIIRSNKLEVAKLECWESKGQA